MIRLSDFADVMIDFDKLVFSPAYDADTMAMIRRITESPFNGMMVKLCDTYGREEAFGIMLAVIDHAGEEVERIKNEHVQN